jgi:hypothetical protein
LYCRFTGIIAGRFRSCLAALLAGARTARLRVCLAGGSASGKFRNTGNIFNLVYLIFAPGLVLDIQDFCRLRGVEIRKVESNPVRFFSFKSVQKCSEFSYLKGVNPTMQIKLRDCGGINTTVMTPKIEYLFFFSEFRNGFGIRRDNLFIYPVFLEFRDDLIYNFVIVFLRDFDTV